MGWLELFGYQQTAVGDGEWYRLLTAHFIHLNGAHAFWNLAGLALLALAFRCSGRARSFFAVFWIALVSISITLWVVPSIMWYCGLSGVLFGLISYLFCDWSGSLKLGALLTLILVTVSYLSDLINPGTPVLHLAHIAGSLAGILAYQGHAVLVNEFHHDSV